MFKPSKKLARDLLHRSVRQVLKRNQPDVIMVSGSYGKTTTASFIHSVLQEDFTTAKSPFYLNNEYDLAHWMLDLKYQSVYNLRGYYRQRKNIRRAVVRKQTADILVCEAAASVSPDSNYQRQDVLDFAISMMQPKIGVLTEIGPCHLEYFKTIQNIQQKKKAVVTKIDQSGHALINYDNPLVREAANEVGATKHFFGLQPNSGYWARQVTVTENGLVADIVYQNETVRLSMPHLINRKHIYAVMPAFICGKLYGMSNARLVEKIAKLEPAERRGVIVKINQGPIFINDSFNANIFSMQSALDSLSDYAGRRRRIAVLGDMFELGEAEEKIHRQVGRYAANKTDILLACGKRARHLATAAAKAGLKNENIIWTENKDEAAAKLKKITDRQDVILLKGSHGNELWKIIDQFQNS